MFTVLDKSYDKVIDSAYLTIMADYKFAIERLVPLINKLNFQRSPLRKSFYNRLEQDIINGCIMPFLTIAIKKDIKVIPVDFEKNAEELLNLLEDAFVLDGIQRLNTLIRASENPHFDSTRPIFFNLLICNSMDKFLYRMVTLNNGQKPMTARHQIEVLADNMFDCNKMAIVPVTEKEIKEKKIKKDSSYMMSKDTLIKSYIAYISNSINIDNQKIIESKMDELITTQIMDSNITTRNTQFSDIIDFVSEKMKNKSLHDWFSLANNMIGFSAAMSVSFDSIKNITETDFLSSIENFEEAFSAIDVSKIKLGLARRRMVKYFFENYNKLSELDNNKLLDIISMEI
jgi:hypothetical protein